MSDHVKRTAGWSAVLLACALFAVRLAPIAARQAQAGQSRPAAGTAGATTTRLADGRSLVVGGEGAESRAQVWDTQTQTGTATATPLQTPRTAHTATLLSDGTVLIVGGRSNNGPRNSPNVRSATNMFTPVPMAGATARAAHTATLTDGRV